MAEKLPIHRVRVIEHEDTAFFCASDLVQMSNSLAARVPKEKRAAVEFIGNAFKDLLHMYDGAYVNGVRVPAEAHGIRFESIEP